ncbi:MAG: hypothetical protein RLZZ308_293 [Candidatus Parcubacteria bacterium]|jgi:lipoprotein-anchoring transpeptidase ErfK/SrfK
MLLLSGVVLFVITSKPTGEYIPQSLSKSITKIPPVQPLQQENKTPSQARTYIEVTDSCSPYHEGVCVNVRSGPSTTHPVITTLRNGVVLQVDYSVMTDDGLWYKIIFDEWLRYPERVSTEWYISSRYVTAFTEVKEEATESSASTTKHIVIDRSEQMLYAYTDTTLFMKESISTGIEITPTPRGHFTIYKKIPTRYMQGPLPEISDKYYDLPGVPWNLYFTEQGAVIHGAYWHDKFGKKWSNGCVNMRPEKARELYQWASVGVMVIVQD